MPTCARATARVSCLAGRAEGEAEFHVVEKLHGFSSTVRERAAGAREFGAGFKTISKPVRTLAALIAEAGIDTIDFLKIDVEGAEADVLAGIDFERVRPRVILAEAVAPGSMTDASAAWEQQLTSRGYRFAFFDRLNRFYVAQEAADLAARLPKEPAAWTVSPIYGTVAGPPIVPITQTTSWRRCCNRGSLPRCLR